MTAKKNVFDLILPLYWGIQGVCLLSYRSISIIIIAIVLLLISLLKIVIKSGNYNVVFLVLCTLYSVCLCIAAFLLFTFFKMSVLWLLFTIANFIVIAYMLRLYGGRQ